MTNSSRISGKKILVTGASGFIGTHLCNKLYINGAEIHGISRIKHSEGASNIRWWQGDLADIKIARRILSEIKPDIIFHLASHVAGSRDLDHVLPTFHSNLTTTVNILNVATDLMCNKIIITGSLEEPGPGDSGAIPSSPYAAAKWAGSAYARMFHALYKTPVVLARLFMVYGPGQRDLTKLIPYVTLSLLRNQSPKLSSGKRDVDWIYVEDVVDGLIATALTPNIEGSIIDIGSGDLISIRTVVEHLSNLIRSKGDPLFGALQDRPMEQVRTANVAETFAKTGWRPAMYLEKGLALTVNWYRNHFIESEKMDIGTL